MIEVLQDTRHPFSLVTKGSGVERDLDLIAPMAAQGLAAVYVTITTLDAKLARQLEPRAAAPHRRLRTIRALAEAGVPVGVSVAPQIPFINTDMEQVLEAAWRAGARRAFYTVLRLPWEVAPLFRQWLELHYPRPRAARAWRACRRCAAGRTYDADFATRMKGQRRLGRPDAPALRENLRAPGLWRAARGAGHEPVPAGGRGGAGAAVLSASATRRSGGQFAVVVVEVVGHEGLDEVVAVVVAGMAAQA